MKKIVRLTERDLHDIIFETVINIMDNADMEDPESLFVPNEATQKANNLTKSPK